MFSTKVIRFMLSSSRSILRADLISLSEIHFPSLRATLRKNPESARDVLTVSVAAALILIVIMTVVTKARERADVASSKVLVTFAR